MLMPHTSHHRLEYLTSCAAKKRPRTRQLLHSTSTIFNPYSWNVGSHRKFPSALDCMNQENEEARVASLLREKGSHTNERLELFAKGQATAHCVGRT